MTVATEEKTIAHTDPVACDGNGPGMGHPRVFLPFAGKSEVVCPYCSRRYVLAEDAKSGH